VEIVQLLPTISLEIGYEPNESAIIAKVVGKEIKV
jgi:hypothetical protein